MHRRCAVVLVCALLLGAVPLAWGQPSPVERDEPPRADRIALSVPDESGLITITGDTNSTYPGAVVGIRNLYSGEFTFASASFTGAFAAQLPGVPGNPFLIQADNDYPARGAQFPAALPGDIGMIVHAPARDDGGFSMAGLYEGARWRADIEASSLDVETGAEWTLQLDVAAAAPEPFDAALRLQPIAINDDGLMRPATVTGSSGWVAETTPTGMPIDGIDSTVPLGELTQIPLPDSEDGNTRFSLRFDGTLPDDLPTGLYAPLLDLPDGGVTRLPMIVRAGAVDTVPLPVALFMDSGTDGARGLLAENAVGALSHGARWNGPDFILPPGSYPIEPYLPTQLLNRSDRYTAPLIPLDLPGGELHVTIAQPDGGMVHLNAAITQNWMGTTEEDERVRFGGGPTDVYRLTTSDPNFAAYPFDQYGAYTITLDLTVADEFGNLYTGGGDYHLLIAEPLQLFPGLLPGAPIPAGQPVYGGVRISPPVPAEVTATLETAGLDSVTSTTRLSGRASRYGTFVPANALDNDTPGEYRLDTSAAYTDAEGRLWAGSLRSAGVITDPSRPLIAHGARGAYEQPGASAPARYSLRGLAAQTGDADLLDGAILNQPYYGGGIAKTGGSSAYGLAFPLRLQDVVGDYARWLIETGAVDSLSAARGDLPAEIPGYAYAYISAVTPAVSVRQQVAGGADGGLPAWVDADDSLNQQIGAGAAGLAAGDMVFLFGGAVVRAAEATVETTAGYAGLALITEDDDPEALGVLAPAHLGAAPLAFIPTGAFPGQRLTVGDPIVIAGQVAPPLPARVTAEITSPAGETQTFTIEANEFGYAFDPAMLVAANRPGVWRVKLSAETESGSAGVPGIDGEAFSLYVLPANSEPLDWNRLITDIPIPGATAYNFNLAAPDDWTDVRGYVTLTTPGTVLADGEVRLAGRSFSTQYNPADIQRDFLNFEVEGRLAGPQVSDAVTLTVAFTGRDASGEPQISARAFTFRHDRLIALETAGSQP